jgi:hypothetical protein
MGKIKALTSIHFDCRLLFVVAVPPRLAGDELVNVAIKCDRFDGEFALCIPFALSTFDLNQSRNV